MAEHTGVIGFVTEIGTRTSHTAIMARALEIPAVVGAADALAVIRKVPFFADVSTRFEAMAEEHRTFVLLDPSGNLLEFKHYGDPRMMY